MCAPFIQYVPYQSQVGTFKYFFCMRLEMHLKSPGFCSLKQNKNLKHSPVSYDSTFSLAAISSRVMGGGA